MEYIQYIGILQWAILALCIVLCFIRGVFRGTKKSLYYSLVNISLMTLLLIVLGNISLRSFLPPEELLNTVKSVLGFLPDSKSALEFVEQYEQYFLDPSLNPIVYALVDSILRILALILVYPLVMIILKYAIFIPVYRFGIRPAIIRNQNKRLSKHLVTPGEMKYYTKKVRKSFGNRIGGGFIGAIKGLVSGFVLVVPLVVVTALAGNIELNKTENNLAADNSEQSIIDDDFLEVIEYLKIANDNGIRIVTDNLKINDVPLDRVLFDNYFNTAYKKVYSDGSHDNLNFSLFGEIEGLVNIAAMAYNEGYLTKDFLENEGYLDLSKEDSAFIDAVFGGLSESLLLTELIPVAVKVLIPLLPELLSDGMIAENLYDNPEIKALLDYFTDIDFKQEIISLGSIFNKVLETGTLREWLDSIDLLSSYEELEAEQLAETVSFLIDGASSVLTELGKLKMMSAVNIGLYIASSIEEVQDLITWEDTADKKQAYILEYFDFAISNPEYFIDAENNFFEQIAALLKGLGNQEYLVDIINAMVDGDPAALINESYNNYVDGVVKKITDIDFLLRSIPFGVDVAFYMVSDNSELSAEFLEEIHHALNDDSIVWKNEIESISNIYSNISNAAINMLFGDDPDLLSFIDDTASRLMPQVKSIIQIVFSDSKLVNSVLENLYDDVVKMLLVDNGILDDIVSNPAEFANFVIDLLSDDGKLSYKIGKELIDILSIAEILYSEFSLAEIANTDFSDIEALLGTVEKLGKIKSSDFDELVNTFTNLQLISRVQSAEFKYLYNELAAPLLEDSDISYQVYIPETVEIKNDFATILNLGYYVANYVITAKSADPNIKYQDIDFTNLLADQTFRSYLYPIDGSSNHSNLLFYNIVNFMKNTPDELAFLADNIEIPTELQEANIESAMWESEIYVLLDGAFDLVLNLAKKANISLSYNEIATYLTEDGYKHIELSVIYELRDYDVAHAAFGKLESSLILRTTGLSLLTALMDNLSELAFNEEYYITTPEDLVANGMLNDGLISSLVHVLANIAYEANDIIGEYFVTIDDVLKYIDREDIGIDDALDVYNNLSTDTIELVAGNVVVGGYFSSVLLDAEFQSYARSMVNDLIDSNTELELVMSENFLNFQRVDGKFTTDELAGVLLLVQYLELRSSLFTNYQTELLEHLKVLEANWNKINAANVNNTIFKEIIDFVVRDENIVDYLVDFVDTNVNDFITSIELLENFEIRSFRGTIENILYNYSDKDGHFDLTEVRVILKSFNQLNISSFDDFSKLTDLDFIHAKVRDTLVIEKLFESRIINDYALKVLSENQMYADLGADLSKYLYDNMSIEIEITAADFAFEAPWYGLIINDVDGRRVNVAEVKQFILSGTYIDLIDELADFSFDGLAWINRVTDLMFDTKPGATLTNLDYMLQSKAIMALFDKLLNFNYSETFTTLYKEFGNYYLAYYATEDLDFSEIVLTMDTFKIHADVFDYHGEGSDAIGTLKASEISNLFKTLHYFDFSKEINFQFIYDLVENDTFVNIFDSKILHSLLSNILKDESLRSFGHNLINDRQDFLEIPASFLVFEDELFLDDNKNLINPKEIENIVVALKSVGITNLDALSGLGIETLNDLTSEDIDNILNSNFIYILIDKVMKYKALGEKAAAIISEALDVETEYINLVPSNDVLGTSGVEEGRVTKNELRNIIKSLQSLELTALSADAINVELVTNLLDPNSDGIIKYDIFIASLYIHDLIDRTLNSDVFGKFAAKLVSEILDIDKDNVDLSVPIDAKDANGRIDKDELKQMIKGIDIFGFVDIPTADDISLTKIYGMINGYERAEIDELLDSKYFMHIISKAMLSKEILDKISGDLFTVDEFTLPESSFVLGITPKRFTALEIKRIILALETLEIYDFKVIEVDIEKIITLGETQLFDDKGTADYTDDTGLISSNYIYAIMHYAFNNTEAIVVPQDSINDVLNHHRKGYIYEQEILNVVKVLNITGMTTLDNINANAFYVSELDDIMDLPNPNGIDKGSPIVEKLISDVLEDKLPSTIPTRVYNDMNLPENTRRITHEELIKLVEAINLLTADPTTTILSSLVETMKESIQSVTVIEGIVNTDSQIVHRIVSEKVFEIFDNENDIPVISYYGNGTGETIIDTDEFGVILDLTRSEVIKIINVLTILDLQELGDISGNMADNISASKFKSLIDLDSPFMDRTISNALKDIENGGGLEIPNESYADTKHIDIRRFELYALASAMALLSGDDASISNVNTVSIDLKLAEIANIIIIDGEESPINVRLVTRALESIKIGSIALVEKNDDAYQDDDDLKVLEIIAFVNKSAILNLETIADTANINVANIASLDSTSLENLISLSEGEESETMWRDFILRLIPLIDPQTKDGIITFFFHP